MSTLSLADSTSLLLGGRQSVLSLSKLRPTPADRIFVHPMDLSEPTSDLLGYTQVCSFKFDELDDLKQTRLNRGSLVCRSASSSENSSLVNGDLSGDLAGDPAGGVERWLPSFLVRLWSRASGRYLCVLPIGASVYARGVFGPMGHFRMVVHAEDVVQFQSTLQPEHHLSIRGNTITGDGAGGADCDLIIRQDDDGYCTLEAEAWPGHYLGVRENGNIMPPAIVCPDSHNAHFIVQKEAMDVL